MWRSITDLLRKLSARSRSVSTFTTSLCSISVNMSVRLRSRESESSRLMSLISHLSRSPEAVPSSLVPTLANWFVRNSRPVLCKSCAFGELDTFSLDHLEARCCLFSARPRIVKFAHHLLLVHLRMSS